MKRKILLMAAIVLCLSISAYGTLAFFTNDYTTHNIITSGGVDIEIVEKGENGEDFTQNQTVMPSTTITKIVTVKNVGDTKAWVRVKLDKEMKLTDKEVTPNLDYMTLNFAENDDGTSKWERKSDGYYYYKEALAAKATTEPLLESVTFAANMPNEYQNATAQVIITAEAVQYDNNPNGNWPETVRPLDPKDSNPVPPVTDPDPEPEPEPSDPGTGGDD